MNKREIDEMMRHLPSQQPPPETLLQKVLIGIMLFVAIGFLMWIPDFEPDCFDQHNHRVSCEAKAK
jgi:hypothetical protein